MLSCCSCCCCCGSPLCVGVCTRGAEAAGAAVCSGGFEGKHPPHHIHHLPSPICRIRKRERAEGGRETTGAVPFWNSLYGHLSQKWPLRHPEISFYYSCGALGAQLQRLSLTMSILSFTAGQKRKFRREGVSTDQGPVLLDEHRVDKSRKGAKTAPR